VFLGNVSGLSMDYTTLYPRIQDSSNLFLKSGVMANNSCNISIKLTVSFSQIIHAKSNVSSKTLYLAHFFIYPYMH
jgi:hypothetical protein